MQELRIVYLAPHNNVLMQHWATRLQNNGHKLLLLSLLQLTYPTNVPFEQLSLRYQKSYLKFWCNRKEIERRLKDFKTDIVHALYSTNYGALAVHQRVCPSIVTIAGSDVLVEPKRSKFLKLANQYVFKHASALNPVSKNLALVLNDEYKIKNNLEIFPEGVDLNLFYPGQDKVSSPIRIVSTRSFEAIYNIELIAKAVPKIIQSVPNSQIVFIGSGSKLKDFKNRLRDYKQVHFLGRMLREKLAVELRKSHIYISTSLSDGTSMSLLEAMACGVFPIVTDIPANREWIENGVNGFLVPTDGENELAQKIKMAIEDEELRNHAQKINIEIIQKKADVEMIISKLENIYYKLVNTI